MGGVPLTAIDIDPKLTLVAASTDRLLETLRARLTDRTVSDPSLLPGWTRGHVLTHLARNADSIERRLLAANRGEMVEQYSGGYKGRAAEIEAGANRSAAELVADVAASASALATTWAQLPAATWEQPVVDVSGAVRLARVMPARRWKEVEIHHVDLDLGYRPRDWPIKFVDEQLEQAVAALPGRLVAGSSVRILPTDRDASWSVGSGLSASGAVSAPAAELLAWLIGRPSSVRGAPVLGPWE
jgi:maleylpyruvate isomerase